MASTTTRGGGGFISLSKFTLFEAVCVYGGGGWLSKLMSTIKIGF